MKFLITGGTGFIGSNLAHHFLDKGEEVVVFDNLSRSGTEKNLKWLKENHQKSGRFLYIKGDVRTPDSLNNFVSDVDVILHLAAQVAVTTSVEDPRTDFDVNALGTFNVIEAARLHGNNPIIIFTSTNKVYGGMEDISVVEKDNRYVFRDYPHGIDESRILDFHSPYGCSKGAADQYIRDYARIYGLRTVVFRMSCIYGTRQFGNEDQGWVAHFVISSLMKRGINIYGDGKQVRDILFVDDLVRAFECAIEKIDATQGNVYNIGGGSQNTTSLLELIDLLEQKCGKKIPTTFHDWRPGDQPVYISDVRKAQETFRWVPTISPQEGVTRLMDWVNDNRNLFT